MRPGGVYPGLLLREQPGTGSMCADVTTGTVWGVQASGSKVTTSPSLTRMVLVSKLLSGHPSNTLPTSSPGQTGAVWPPEKKRAWGPSSKSET